MAGIFFGFFVSIAPLFIGILIFPVEVMNAVALALGIILSCFTFAAMGIVFASVPTESVGNIMMPLNFVRIPLLFISGVFIPIGELPLIGQVIACLSPLTHTLVLVRTGLGVESFSIPLEASAVALVVTSLLFLYLSFKFHEIIKKRE